MTNKNNEITEPSILDYWPTPSFTPRDNQIKALEWMEKQKAKYLILELPVGSGKSLLGINLSKFISKSTGSSFILTPQRILQDQYENDFKDHGKKLLASLHGKGNYKCQDKHTTCNIGSIVKPRCKDCPHSEAKKLAREASNTVLNYKLALTSFSYTETFTKRRLMIMDEAHTLERHLVDFDSVDIMYARCKRYDINFKVQKTLSTALNWVKETYEERFNKGEEPESLDKEFFRLWVRAQGFEYEDKSTWPEITGDVRTMLASKYIDLKKHPLIAYGFAFV